mmetsp:Transcript_62833/g.147394  ORF Transcript_62833/g.147394 Transcript_62833/m.147394 type:complete len:365 (-) Transcript_62833:540-1634(-)
MPCVVKEESWKNERNQGSKYGAAEAVSQPQVLEEAGGSDNGSQEEGGHGQKLVLRHVEDRHRGVSKAGKAQRKGENDRQTNRNSRSRHESVLLRVVVQNEALRRFAKGQVANRHDPEVHRKRKAESASDHLGEFLRRGVLQLGVILWGVIVCNERSGKRSDQNECCRAALPVNDSTTEVWLVLGGNEVIKLTPRSIRAIYVANVHHQHHPNLPDATDRRSVGQHTKLFLKAKRQKNEETKNEQGSLGRAPQPAKAEELQCSCKGLANHDGKGEARESRLDQENNRHELSQAWAGDCRCAIFVACLPCGMASSSHDGEGVAHERSEGGCQKAADEQTCTSSYASRQAQHALSDNIFHDVEEQLHF